MLKKKIIKTNIRVEINIVIESIIVFDVKVIFKRRKILEKDNAKVIMRYNDKINSIDLKLYVNLIYYVIDSISSRRRFIFELLFNFCFENESLFEL